MCGYDNETDCSLQDIVNGIRQPTSSSEKYIKVCGSL